MLIHVVGNVILVKESTKEEEIHIMAHEKYEVHGIILDVFKEHMYEGYSRENFQGSQ